MKIIQINGFRGLLAVVFIGICTFAGFVLFPGMVTMHLWNKYLVTLASFPVISTFQGTLLWGIIAVSYLILSKGASPVAFKRVNELSNSEVDDIIKNAKIQSQIKKLNREIQLSDKFEKSKDKFLNVHKNNLSDSNNTISPISEVKSDNEETISDIK